MKQARNNKGIVILVNKWDLVDKKTNTIKLIEEGIRKEIERFVDVPIVFISSLTKQRIFKAIETAMQVYKSRKKSNEFQLIDFLVKQVLSIVKKMNLSPCF